MMTLCAFITGVSELLTAGVLDHMARDVDVSLGAAGSLIFWHAAAYAAVPPLLLSLLRSNNQRAALAAAMAAFAVASFGAASAPDLAWLTVARIAQGAAGGTVLAVAIVVATAAVPRKHQGKALSSVLMGLSLSLVVGVPASRSPSRRTRARTSSPGTTPLCVTAASRTAPRASGPTITPPTTRPMSATRTGTNCAASATDPETPRRPARRRRRDALAAASARPRRRGSIRADRQVTPRPGSRHRGRDDQLLTEEYRSLLKWSRAADREGLQDTPDRVARMYDEIFSGLRENPADHLKTQFTEDRHEDIVVVRDIQFYSVCEHHLVPFFGNAHVAYIPKNGKITGLSKVARCVHSLARRPQLQERLTNQIVSTMTDALDPHGVMAPVEAEHFCMAMRGVRSPP